MIFLWVAPSGWGKTFAIQSWMLPELATRPRALSPLAPQRFDLVLVDDPPTGQKPRGQYPGSRYMDVADFRRAREHTRLSCFSSANSESLARLALEHPRTLLVMDEIDLKFPAGKKLDERDPRRVIAERGRHFGVALVGGARRLHAVNVAVRANVQRAWFGHMREASDRKDAAEMMGVSRRALERTRIEPQTFIEWDGSTGNVELVRFVNGRRVARPAPFRA